MPNTLVQMPLIQSVNINTFIGKIAVIKRSIIYLERLKIAGEPSNSAYIRETCGIREHAIDILDGGKEAFEKRKNKYKI